jgi:hypothetical protein
MSFFSTPRKSPRKHASTHTPSSPVGRVNSVMKWENEHEDRLIDILREFLEKGARPPYGQKIILRIAERLNNQLNDGTQYTDHQVGDKIRRIRKDYDYYSSLKMDNIGTGFGWDEDRGTIDVASKQWEHIRRVSFHLD